MAGSYRATRPGGFRWDRRNVLPSPQGFYFVRFPFQQIRRTYLKLTGSRKLSRLNNSRRLLLSGVPVNKILWTVFRVFNRLKIRFESDLTKSSALSQQEWDRLRLWPSSTTNISHRGIFLNMEKSPPVITSYVVKITCLPISSYARRTYAFNPAALPCRPFR